MPSNNDFKNKTNELKKFRNPPHTPLGKGAKNLLS